MPHLCAVDFCLITIFFLLPCTVNIFIRATGLEIKSKLPVRENVVTSFRLIFLLIRVQVACKLPLLRNHSSPQQKSNEGLQTRL